MCNRYSISASREKRRVGEQTTGTGPVSCAPRSCFGIEFPFTVKPPDLLTTPGDFDGSFVSIGDPFRRTTLAWFASPFGETRGMTWGRLWITFCPNLRYWPRPLLTFLSTWCSTRMLLERDVWLFFQGTLIGERMRRVPRTPDWSARYWKER